MLGYSYNNDLLFITQNLMTLAQMLQSTTKIIWFDRISTKWRRVGFLIQPMNYFCRICGGLAWNNSAFNHPHSIERVWQLLFIRTICWLLGLSVQCHIWGCIWFNCMLSWQRSSFCAMSQFAWCDLLIIGVIHVVEEEAQISSVLLLTIWAAGVQKNYVAL